MKNYAPMIRRARYKKELSLQDLANITGLSKPHLYELENGKSQNPTGRTIELVSKALDLQPADWF
jgi:transcriptional regulator with XRE-family HTH domain